MKKSPLKTIDRHDAESDDANHALIKSLRKQIDDYSQRITRISEERDRLKEFVEDAAAYLRHSSYEGTSNFIILGTLAHDISGLDRNEPCFLPRVTGYRKAEQERAKKLL